MIDARKEVMEQSLERATNKIMNHSNSNQIVFLWFSIQVPYLLLFMSQLVLPTSWFPGFLLWIHRFYNEHTHDPILGVPQLWFQSLISMAILFQVPFMVYYLKENWDERRLTQPPTSPFSRYPIAFSLYASNLLTMSIPVFFETIYGKHEANNVWLTLLFHSPWAIMSIWMIKELLETSLTTSIHPQVSARITTTKERM